MTSHAPREPPHPTLDAATVTDAELDALLPPWAARLSRDHWTPVAVARTAAAFLVGSRGASARVLDVGSGAGKFCVIGAGVTGARFLGVDMNQHLVDAARALARTAGAPRARFRRALAESIQWGRFHGIYLFNPFSEQLIAERVDEMRGSEPRCAAYVHHVRSALAKLYLMPAGTRVATFQGMGAAALPPGYELVRTRCFGEQGTLRLYERVDPLTLENAMQRLAPLDDAGLFEEPTVEMTRAPHVDEDAS